MRNRAFGAAVLTIVLAMAVSGCATRLRSIPTDFQPTGETSTIVIGRIELLRENGDPFWKPIAALKPLSEPLQLVVKHEQTGRDYIITGVDPGAAATDFYVAMVPGRYRITEVTIGVLKSEFKAMFDIPRAVAVYVGTLRFTGKYNSFVARMVGSMASGRWSVEDTREAVVRRFRAQYPRLADQVTPSLIRPGKPPLEARARSDSAATP